MKRSRQDVRSEAELRGALLRALAGVIGPEEDVPRRVVWQDGADEVLVHVDSVSLRLERGAVVVGVDLESQEAGRGPVIVVVAVGTGPDSRGLFGMTEASARGEPLLSARYGGAVASAVWAAISNLARAPRASRGGLHEALARWLDHAADAIRSHEPEAEPGEPDGVAVVDGHLCFYRDERSAGNGTERERGKA